MSTATVAQRTALMWNGHHRINATLSWSVGSPHEVLLILTPRNLGGVVWRFALDLLAEGLNGPAGLGDVSLFPCLDDSRYVELILHDSTSVNDTGAGFTVARRALRDFLAKIQVTGSTMTTHDTKTSTHRGTS